MPSPIHSPAAHMLASTHARSLASTHARTHTHTRTHARTHAQEQPSPANIRTRTYAQKHKHTKKHTRTPTGGPVRHIFVTPHNTHTHTHTSRLGDIIVTPPCVLTATRGDGAHDQKTAEIPKRQRPRLISTYIQGGSDFSEFFRACLRGWTLRIFS